MNILGKEDGAPHVPKSPDWKSGANAMRAIYMTALKRGRDDNKSSTHNLESHPCFDSYVWIAWDSGLCRLAFDAVQREDVCSE